MSAAISATVSAVRSVSVFCGSSPGKSASYRRSAEELGRGLAERRIRIVYGGGGTGMMGTVADSALAAGGEVIGVIPTFLAEREVNHKGLSEVRVVATMHERKQLMFELSDAACALPGGLGTLDELVEMITWHQLDLHARPMVIVSTEGYWEGLQALVEAIVAGGFAQDSVRAMMRFVPDAAAAIEALMRVVPQPEPAAARL